MRHPVIVVGAGPVGLTMAIDLAQQGVPVVVLDDDNKLSVGSRAICFAKRTLEIWDRLGAGQRMVDKGVPGMSERCISRTNSSTRSTCCPTAVTAGRRSSTCNSTTAKSFLYEAAAALPNLDLRWKNKVAAVEQHADHVQLTVETPDGPYRLQAQYIVACDGARSPLRTMLGQESKGRVFRDRFLIADVKMKADFPAERWFWFDPPFHRNQSVLLHMQPDNVWRIDFQLGWDADPEEEKKPEKVIPRIKACWARTRNSILNGSASTHSPACAWTSSAMAGSSSPATRRTASRRSARAAPTRACKTLTIWHGN